MHNCLLPHFLLAIYFGYAEENGNFQIPKHRLKGTKIPFSSHSVSNQCSRKTSRAPYFPCLILFRCFIAVEGHSLFANIQWLIIPRSGWQRSRTPFPSTGHITHLQNNYFPTLLARSFLFAISGFIQGRSKAGERLVMKLMFSTCCISVCF